MAYVLQAFTSGMVPLPYSVRAVETFAARRAASSAERQALRDGMDIDAALAAGAAAWDAHMAEFDALETARIHAGGI